MPERLSVHQRVVLGEIVFGGYVSNVSARLDNVTLRSLERRGLIEPKRDPQGVMLCPPDYQATKRGRTEMVRR